MHPHLSMLAFGLFTGFTSAQYQIAPSSVPESLRNYWCDQQMSQCPLICLQYPGANGAEANNCDASNLSYECLCDNGMTPNASEYSQTLPYFVCTEWGNQCTKGCANSNTCADACRTQHPCGARDPTRASNTTQSSTADGSASSTSDAASTQTFGAFGSSASSSSSANAAPSYTATYPHVGNKLGFLVVGAGVIGGFALFL